MKFLLPRKGLLKHRELERWKRAVLSRLGLSAGFGSMREVAGGISFSTQAAAALAPFDVVTKMENGSRLSCVVTPGVVIGLNGFIVPTINGVEITADTPPAISNPGKCLLFKLVAQPSLLDSTVRSSNRPVVISAQWISAEILSTDDPDDTAQFPVFDGIAWTRADPTVKQGISYRPFAQWSEDDGRYLNVFDGVCPFSIGSPGIDLENYDQGDIDTAYWGF